MLSCCLGHCDREHAIQYAVKIGDLNRNHSRTQKFHILDCLCDGVGNFGLRVKINRYLRKMCSETVLRELPVVRIG